MLRTTLMICMEASVIVEVVMVLQDKLCVGWENYITE
jgi:hypothetical protein